MLTSLLNSREILRPSKCRLRVSGAPPQPARRVRKSRHARHGAPASRHDTRQLPAVLRPSPGEERNERPRLAARLSALRTQCCEEILSVKCTLVLGGGITYVVKERVELEDFHKY